MLRRALVLLENPAEPAPPREEAQAMEEPKEPEEHAAAPVEPEQPANAPGKNSGLPAADFEAAPVEPPPSAESTATSKRAKGPRPAQRTDSEPGHQQLPLLG